MRHIGERVPPQITYYKRSLYQAEKKEKDHHHVENVDPPIPLPS